jgi:hypothetical protein
VTFGQPRVGDAIFAKDVASKVTEYRRYVVGNDIIARSPSTHSGYAHSGMLIHVDREEKLSVVTTETAPLQWMTGLTKLSHSLKRDENVLRLGVRLVVSERREREREGKKEGEREREMMCPRVFLSVALSFSPLLSCSLALLVSCSLSRSLSLPRSRSWQAW